MRRFVGRPIAPTEDGFLATSGASDVPVLRAFVWDDRTLRISSIVRAWRTTKSDRGDTYLKRHWFQLITQDGATIEIYFDREARRGAPYWWLYTIDR